MIEFQQLHVQYRHVFGLQCLLLCAEQIAFFSQQFYGILHAQVELLLNQFIAGLRAFQFLRGGGVALLGAVGIEPEGFDGLVQRFLVVQQVQFAGLFLNLGFLYGTLGLPVAEDGHAYGEAQRVVPV